MRRWVGIALAGLGAFLLAGAALLRFSIPGQVLRYPLNEYISTTLQGNGMSYFSPVTGKPVTGATLRVTATIKGDAAKGTSATAVWNQFTYLYDLTNRMPVTYQRRTFAFDRRSGELVNCCGASVNGNPEIRQYGLGEFPVGTRPVTYQVFDPALNQTRPARYAGTATVDGIPVYRFVERVPLTRVGSLLTLSAALLGLPGSSDVTLTQYYRATNTFWVDPVTGAQLNTTQDQAISYLDASGVQRLLFLSGKLAMTPPTIRALVSQDTAARGKVTALTVTAPLAAAGAGALALVAGLLLARAGRDGTHGFADEDAEPALDPAI